MRNLLNVGRKLWTIHKVSLHPTVFGQFSVSIIMIGYGNRLMIYAEIYVENNTFLGHLVGQNGGYIVRTSVRTQIVEYFFRS